MKNDPSRRLREATVQTRARQLQRALRDQGLTPPDHAVPEGVVREWTRTETPGGLETLRAALTHQGLALDGLDLGPLAWALLGTGRVRAARLGRDRDARLLHLAELHDIPGPFAVGVLGSNLAGEGHLVSDLLHARPWLRAPEGPHRVREVLEAVFRTEWSGFLVLLGEFGPWAYVPSVADLQRLSRAYRELVEAAASRTEDEVLEAALRLGRDFPGTPLLARLEATDYRQTRGKRRGGPPDLQAREEAFWHAAREQARQRRDDWAAGRRP